MFGKIKKSIRKKGRDFLYRFINIDHLSNKIFTIIMKKQYEVVNLKQ